MKSEKKELLNLVEKAHDLMPQLGFCALLEAVIGHTRTGSIFFVPDWQLKEKLEEFILMNSPDHVPVMTVSTRKTEGSIFETPEVMELAANLDDTKTTSPNIIDEVEVPPLPEVKLRW